MKKYIFYPLIISCIYISSPNIYASSNESGSEDEGGLFLVIETSPNKTKRYITNEKKYRKKKNSEKATKCLNSYCGCQNIIYLLTEKIFDQLSFIQKNLKD